jgi:hypothetical protein
MSLQVHLLLSVHVLSHLYQLPGLSDDVHLEVNMSNAPPSKGYAIRWYDKKKFENYDNKIITTCIVLLIVTSKQLIIAFCYECYQKLIKHKIHRKTHKWYYAYWAIKVVILAGMLVLIAFVIKHQQNRISRITFLTSLGIDAILGLTAVFILSCKKYSRNPCASCRKYSSCCESWWTEQPIVTQSDEDTYLVPPPLSLCCQCFCFRKIQDESDHKEANETTPLFAMLTRNECLQTYWTVLMNAGSLMIFVAFLSYLTQALPAIAISWYINSSSSLIRIGFFELSFAILVEEIAFLIFLVDKFVWFCYIHKEESIPEEVYYYELEQFPDQPTNQPAEDDTTSAEDHRDGIDGPQARPAANPHPGKQAPKKMIKYVNQYTYLSDDGKHKLKGFGRWKCSYKICHWLFIFTIFQIVAVSMLIGISVPLLYFVMSIVIDQTSDSSNQFKDILTLIPTIALNVWLLWQHRSIPHAVKNIVSKANASAKEHHNGHDQCNA